MTRNNKAFSPRAADEFHIRGVKTSARLLLTRACNTALANAVTRVTELRHTASQICICVLSLCKASPTH